MRRFILNRLLWLIPVMLVISFIAFSLMYLSPGDPATIFLSQGGDVPTAEAVVAMREKLGLNEPFYIQYGRWLNDLFHGDMGTSIFTGKPVLEEIRIYFPNTLKLTFLAVALTILLSVPLGMICAVQQNRLTDNFIRVCSFVAGSLPGFFAALILVYVLGVKLRWLPTISSGSSKGIWIPTLTLVLTMSPNYIRQVRAAIIKELDEGYVRLLRGRGIREKTIFFCDILKSVMPSILTIGGISVGQLLGGTAIIEIVCTYQGIGRLAVSSITNKDYPLMQGFVLLMAVIYVLVNLAVDILHAYADPRVKNQFIEESKWGSHAKKKKAA